MPTVKIVVPVHISNIFASNTFGDLIRATDNIINLINGISFDSFVKSEGTLYLTTDQQGLIANNVTVTDTLTVRNLRITGEATVNVNINKAINYDYSNTANPNNSLMGVSIYGKGLHADANGLVELRVGKNAAINANGYLYTNTAINYDYSNTQNPNNSSLGVSIYGKGLNVDANGLVEIKVSKALSVNSNGFISVNTAKNYDYSNVNNPNNSLLGVSIYGKGLHADANGLVEIKVGDNLFVDANGYLTSNASGGGIAYVNTAINYDYSNTANPNNSLLGVSIYGKGLHADANGVVVVKVGEGLNINANGFIISTGGAGIVANDYYLISGGVFGKPASNALVQKFVFPNDSVKTLPQNLLKSRVSVGTNPTQNTIFTLKKVSEGNTSNIGSLIVYTTGSYSFDFPSDVPFINGEVLEVYQEGVSDTTLADISWTFITKEPLALQTNPNISPAIQYNTGMAIPYELGGVIIGNGLDVNVNGLLEIKTGDGLNFTPEGNVYVNTAINYNYANTSDPNNVLLGTVIVGDGVHVNESGLLELTAAKNIFDSNLYTTIWTIVRDKIVDENVANTGMNSTISHTTADYDISYIPLLKSTYTHISTIISPPSGVDNAIITDIIDGFEVVVPPELIALWYSSLNSLSSSVANSGIFNTNPYSNGFGGVIVDEGLTSTDGVLSVYIPRYYAEVPGGISNGFSGLQIVTDDFYMKGLALKPATTSVIGGVITSFGLAVDLQGNLQVEAGEGLKCGPSAGIGVSVTPAGKSYPYLLDAYYDISSKVNANPPVDAFSNLVYTFTDVNTISTVKLIFQDVFYVFNSYVNSIVETPGVSLVVTVDNGFYNFFTVNFEPNRQTLLEKYGMIDTISDGIKTKLGAVIIDETKGLKVIDNGSKYDGTVSINLRYSSEASSDNSGLGFSNTGELYLLPASNLPGGIIPGNGLETKDPINNPYLVSIQPAVAFNPSWTGNNFPLGGVIIGNGLSVDANGTIQIKTGNGLSINANGYISSSGVSNTVSEKTTLVSNDVFNILDSEDSYSVKKVIFETITNALDTIYTKLSGFIMTGNIVMNWNRIVKGKFQGIAENIGTSTISGTELSLDLSSGNYFQVNLSSNITSIELTNLPTIIPNTAVPLSVEFYQPSGGATVTWTANSISNPNTIFTFPGGSAPAITSTAGAVDIFSGVIVPNSNLGSANTTVIRLVRNHADSK